MSGIDYYDSDGIKLSVGEYLQGITISSVPYSTPTYGNKTILVTGCVGYIGSRLLDQLAEFYPHYNVVGLDNYTYGQNVLKYSQFTYYNGDVRDSKLIANIVRKHNVSIVIHLAAYVGMGICDKKGKGETVDVNVRATENLVKLLDRDVRLIYPNTNSGYGAADEEICTEQSEVKPLSLYAQSKFDGEKAVLSHVNSLVFRLATVFGDSQRMRMDLLVNDLVWRAHTYNYAYKFEVYQPNARRNYVHITDVCEGLIWAIENGGKQEVYNLGNDSANMTKIELVKLIREYIEFDYTIDETSQDPDKRDYYVSSDKLKNSGFVAEFGLRPGIIELTNKYLGMNGSFPDWYKNV